MATTKKELGDAIARTLDTSGQTIDTPEKAQQLRLTFSQNIANEIDLYVQAQISASFSSLQVQIDDLNTRLTSFQVVSGSNS